MKKFLLMLTGMLLFSADANALSCGARQYLSVSTCGEGTEQCDSCPSGCSSCSGINYSTTCQYWDREQGVIHSYATTTIGSCDSCDSGYELKRYTVSSYDGSTYRSIPYYSCERETIRCPSNCSSCSDSSICTSCDYGYSLSNGKCVSGSGEDSSSKCGNGYVLIDGVCEEICQYQVNLEGGVCMKYCAGTVGSSSQIRRMCLYARCFDGRAPKSTTATYLGENIPHRYCCPENCADCSDWGQCTSCNSGYTLSNGKCVTSVSCNTGYVKKGSTCVKAATCTYPLKEVADYSGECAGCCTD